jgi:hypothetical protein
MASHNFNEYSTELVASIAIRLLIREKRARNVPRAFGHAAEQACRFLDTCRDVAKAHRRASYGLLDEPELGDRIAFAKVLREIGKKGHSLKEKRRLYRQFVRDDLSNAVRLDPLFGSELDAAVDARFEQQEVSGIYRGHLDALKGEFAKWYSERIRRRRAEAGGKGGAASAAKKARRKPSET